MAKPKRLMTTRTPGGVTAEQAAAMLKLIGDPLPPEPERELTPAEMKLLLLKRKQELLTPPPPNPYQMSLTKFAAEMCYTKDEAAGGRVALMPDYPYLREMDDALIENILIIVEKSRRMIASWRACACDLWLASGGQDPRWPQLMNATGNRKIIIAAQHAEGEAGSQDFLLRCRFMVEQIEYRGLRELWPDFPTWEWRQDRGTASNGSVISAVPQGADKLRGSGVTAIHGEEVAFWQNAQDAFKTALHTLRGGGHFYGITTANNASYVERIVSGKLRTGGWA